MKIVQKNHPQILILQINKGVENPIY